MIRRRLAAVAVLAAFPAFLPITACTPTAAAATPCASRAEYRALKVNGTKTPAAVQAHFGVRGRIVGSHVIRVGSRWIILTDMRYPACASGHRVYVRYQGTTGRPAVAIDKAYR